MSAQQVIVRNERGNRVGETHQRARLSDADVDLILMMRFEWRLSYPAISEKFDDFEPRIAVSTIGDICRGNSRGQIGYRFSTR